MRTCACIVKNKTIKPQPSQSSWASLIVKMLKKSPAMGRAKNNQPAVAENNKTEISSFDRRGLNVLWVGFFISLHSCRDAIFHGLRSLTISSNFFVAVLNDFTQNRVRQPRSCCHSNGCSKNNNECGERSFHWRKRTRLRSSSKKTLRHHWWGQTKRFYVSDHHLEHSVGSNDTSARRSESVDEGWGTPMFGNQDIQVIELAPIHQAVGGMDSGGLATATS